MYPGNNVRYYVFGYKTDIKHHTCMVLHNEPNQNTDISITGYNALICHFSNKGMKLIFEKFTIRPSLTCL